jgi:hypothetical protein
MVVADVGAKGMLCRFVLVFFFLRCFSYDGRRCGSESLRDWIARQQTKTSPGQDVSPSREDDRVTRVSPARHEPEPLAGESPTHTQDGPFTSVSLRHSFERPPRAARPSGQATLAGTAPPKTRTSKIHHRYAH